MEKRVYKIRRPDGLYSCGGYWDPRWTKAGKAWTSLGALKNHLHLFFVYNRLEDGSYGHKEYSYPYEGCTLEEHIFTPEVQELSLEKVWEDVKRKKAHG